MNLLVIVFYFLLAIVLYYCIAWLVKDHVNRKISHPVWIKYDYTWQPFKALTDLVIVWWHGRIMQRTLVVDMRFTMRSPDITKPNVKPVKTLVREEYWTDLTMSEIHQRGYLPVKRLHDSIPWVLIPVSLRFDNPQRFEVPDTKDEKGHFIFPQDTPSTHYDKWHSNATKEFIKSMSKLGMRQIDTQTMIMMLIIGGGALFGMWMLGIF